MQQQSLNVAAWRLSKASLLPAAAGASGAASEAKKEFWGRASVSTGPAVLRIWEQWKRIEGRMANYRDDAHRLRLPRAVQLIAHDSQRAVMALSVDIHIQTALRHNLLAIHGHIKPRTLSLGLLPT